MSWRPWGCIAAALVAAACERGAETEDNVRKALDQANIRTVEVEVDPDAQIVHLQGTVETIADRTRANEIATAVVGTSGRVLNELTVESLISRPAGDVDGRTTDAIDAVLDGDRVLRERDVNIEVNAGAVIVTGSVRTAAERARAERLVSRVPGVTNVDNRLAVHPEPQ